MNGTSWELVLILLEVGSRGFRPEGGVSLPKLLVGFHGGSFLLAGCFNLGFCEFKQRGCLVRSLVPYCSII